MKSKSCWNGWSKEEEHVFFTLVSKYKTSFTEYQRHLPSRSYIQIKSHYHNIQKKLKRICLKPDTDCIFQDQFFVDVFE